MAQRSDNKTQRLQQWFDERPRWDHASYGEFMHIGANQTIFRIALQEQDIDADTKVLDTACAVGGNARWMASLYGCQVYGNDIDESTTPLQAGLAWTVKLKAGPFIGRDALVAEKEAGPARRLTGLVMSEAGIPRQGYAVRTEHGEGRVTSGTQSPCLRKGIAMAYVPAAVAEGDRVEVDIRGKGRAAEVASPPFV